MKLSEAILLGSIGSEQGFGSKSMYKESKEKCALGAALLAKGIEVTNQHEKLGLLNLYTHILAIWPWVNNKIKSPVYDLEEPIFYSIFTLNDVKRWTRPQIAEWVANLETIYDPTPHEVSVCPSKMTLHTHSEPLVDLEPVDQTT